MATRMNVAVTLFAAALACRTSGDILVLDDGARVLEGELLEYRADRIVFRANIAGIWTTQEFSQIRVSSIRCMPGNQCDMKVADDAPGMSPTEDGRPRKPSDSSRTGATGQANKNGKSPSRPAPSAGDVPAAQAKKATGWEIGSVPAPEVDAAVLREHGSSIEAALVYHKAAIAGCREAIGGIEQERRGLEQRASARGSDEQAIRTRLGALFFEPERLRKVISENEEAIANLSEELVRRDRILDEIGAAQGQFTGGDVAGARSRLDAALVESTLIPEQWTKDITSLDARWAEVDAVVLARETSDAKRSLMSAEQSLARSIARAEPLEACAVLAALDGHGHARAVAAALEGSADDWKRTLPGAARLIVADASLGTAQVGARFSAASGLESLWTKLEAARPELVPAIGLQEVREQIARHSANTATALCKREVASLVRQVDAFVAGARPAWEPARIEAERGSLERALKVDMGPREWEHASAADKAAALAAVTKATTAVNELALRASLALIGDARKNGFKADSLVPIIGYEGMVTNCAAVLDFQFSAVQLLATSAALIVEPAQRVEIEEWRTAAARGMSALAGRVGEIDRMRAEYRGWQRDFDSAMAEALWVVGLRAKNREVCSGALAYFANDSKVLKQAFNPIADGSIRYIEPINNAYYEVTLNLDASGRRATVSYSKVGIPVNLMSLSDLEVCTKLAQLVQDRVNAALKLHDAVFGEPGLGLPPGSVIVTRPNKSLSAMWNYAESGIRRVFRADGP